MTGDALRREADQHDRNASIILPHAFHPMKTSSVPPVRWSMRKTSERLPTVSIPPADEVGRPPLGLRAVRHFWTPGEAAASRSLSFIRESALVKGRSWASHFLLCARFFAI